MLKKNYLRPGLEWVYKLFFVVQSICMYASVATIAFTVLMRELFRVSIVWGYEITSITRPISALPLCTIFLRKLLRKFSALSTFS